MKQLVMPQGNIIADGDPVFVPESYSQGSAVWNGGHGWLIITSLSLAAGGQLLCSFTLSELGINYPYLPGGTPPLNPPLPASFSEPGLYPFWAPKGTKFTFRATARPGDSVSWGDIWLVGNA